MPLKTILGQYKTAIPLVLVECEMVTANSSLHALLAMIMHYHISNACQ